MKSFEYGDKEISSRELSFAVASVIIGVGILTLPRLLAETSHFGDGVFSILMGGVASTFFAWIIAKLSARFPKQNFYQYTQRITAKSIAILLTSIFSVYMIVLTSLSVRAISNVSKLYMFERTPIEIISLAFFLVVIYAVMGSTTAVLRLNLMFLPIIIFISVALQIMNIRFFEIGNFRPVLTTGFFDILNGGLLTTYSFLGFEIILFYIALMNKPKDAPKATVVGMFIPLALYTLIFVFAIGIFSNVGTSNIIYPTIEMAKEVELPGEFLEHFESIFFTVWIMTIFNTAAMTFDVSIMAIRSIFPKMKKRNGVFVLSPLIYLVAMAPQDFNEITKLGDWMSYFGIFFVTCIPTLLLLISHVRGVRGSA